MERGIHLPGAKERVRIFKSSGGRKEEAGGVFPPRLARVLAPLVLFACFAPLSPSGLSMHSRPHFPRVSFLRNTASVLAAGLATGPGCAEASTLPAVSGERGLFTVARLRYPGGGDWYGDPSSLPNLLRQLQLRTGIRW